MRRYIRHPSSVPIAFHLLADADIINVDTSRLSDVSSGGLCFVTAEKLHVGSAVEIEIPLQIPSFVAQGKVTWCRHQDEKFFVGVVFSDDSAQFGLRMVEQVCYIEQYKRDVLLREGRQLSHDQAASEWITKYAENFPR